MPADTGIATLLAHYAPPSIIFNETHEAVHLFGDVNPFMQAKEGSASLVVNRLLLEPAGADRIGPALQVDQGPERRCCQTRLKSRCATARHVGAGVCTLA